MATRNKKAFVTFGALADIIAPLSQGGVWITGNDFGTNPKATLEKMFPGTTWQDSKTTVYTNTNLTLTTDGNDLKLKDNSNNVTNIYYRSPNLTGEQTGIGSGNSLKYSSGIKLSGTNKPLYMYKRTA